MMHVITHEQIENAVKKLKRNSSPGIDGITGEFLINGISNALLDHLSAIYSYILSYNYVPSTFNTGVMVPVLKKPTPSYAC